MSPTPSEITNPMPCNGNHSTPTANGTAFQGAGITLARKAAMPNTNKPTKIPKNATM